MEKKSYVPKATKYLQKEDGSGQETSYPMMSCKFCNKELTDSQVYEYLRGKTKGYCSRSCGNLAVYYESVLYIPKYKFRNRLLFTNECIVCGSKFESTVKKQKTCNFKCAGKLSSIRMKDNNPMKSLHKEIDIEIKNGLYNKHPFFKPYVQKIKKENEIKKEITIGRKTRKEII